MRDIYLDEEVSYLLGLLVARGELLLQDNAILIHFPKGALLAEGLSTKFDTNKEIQLGIDKIRDRLTDLLGADIRRVDAGDSWDLRVQTTRRTMAWRNITRILGVGTDFPQFHVPGIFLRKDTPLEFKHEFVRGYGDVSGNIRPANRDQAGRHRVRLDILNRKTNWHVPVQICLLLQNYLDIPVPVITWGHPNLGREWREHQLNVYAEEYLRVGFSFEFKQQALEELARSNSERFSSPIKGCPGARRRGTKKARHSEESNADRLDLKLVGKHFNAYWQICRRMGCSRRPAPREQLELIPEE